MNINLIHKKKLLSYYNYIVFHERRQKEINLSENMMNYETHSYIVNEKKLHRQSIYLNNFVLLF